MSNELIPTQEQCDMVSKILKSLSHPQRLMIMCHLSESPKTVGELEELSGASQSSVSQFLARMKAEGLISSKRDNQFVYYDIEDLRVKKLIQAMHKVFI